MLRGLSGILVTGTETENLGGEKTLEEKNLGGEKPWRRKTIGGKNLREFGGFGGLLEWGGAARPSTG